MFVRANRQFEAMIRQFDPAQSIILYSMWDGYRTKSGSTIPDFLALTGTWEPLHTSGHASPEDLRHVIEKQIRKLLFPCTPTRRRRCRPYAPIGKLSC